MPESPRHISILQRVVSHYRVPLFDALHQRLGWRIFTATNFPSEHASLNIVEYYHATDTARFWFPRRTDPYLCWVPLRKLLKNKDLVVAEAGTKMSSTWLLALYARLNPWRKTKIVLWGHGQPVAFATSVFKQRVARILKRALINSVDGYLCYSQADKIYLQEIGIRKPIYISQNSIDITGPLALRDLKVATQNKAPQLLAVGRLLADKNIDMLLDVFIQFLGVHPEAQLTIIGDGPERATLEKQASNHLNTNIHFAGAVYDEAELAAYFNQADAFVTCGAVGLGVNHAIAYGVPVICFQQTVSGPFHHPEICYVEDGISGWQIPTYTATAMAAFLTEKFADTTPREHLKKTLPNYAEENLSLNNMVKVFAQIEADMLGVPTSEKH